MNLSRLRRRPLPTQNDVPPLRPAARHIPGRPVVFTHIPKTAGLSLRFGLQASLDVEPVVGLDRSTFGRFDEFGGVIDAVKHELFLEPEAVPPDTRLLMGHFAYSTTRTALPNAEHLTVIREPRSRLLSHWTFWRAMDDDRLAMWGAWAETLRISHGHFSEFLDAPNLACQLDNTAVRQLLYPHPLIPNDAPIDPADDAAILRDARAVLGQFGFTDVVENPGWAARLESWLGSPLTVPRVNETESPRPELRCDLGRELTPGVAEALARMTRLDRQLWTERASQTLQSADVDAVAEASWAATVARHAVLLA